MTTFKETYMFNVHLTLAKETPWIFGVYSNNSKDICSKSALSCKRNLGQVSKTAPVSTGIHLYFSFLSFTLIQTLDVSSIMCLRGGVQDFRSSTRLSLKSIIRDRHQVSEFSANIFQILFIFIFLFKCTNLPSPWFCEWALRLVLGLVSCTNCIRSRFP